MNPDQKKEIKQAIIEKMKVVKTAIEALNDLSKPVSPDNAIGRLTRMEAISNKSINEASLAKSKQTLGALEKALDAVETQDFGDCLHCEEPIPHKRLMVMPEATLCVSCAEKLNRGRS